MLEAGTVVKESDYALRSLRESYFSEGNYTRKSTKKRWLDERAARRGVIVESKPNGYEIDWRDGTHSSCLSYMVTKADD